MFQQGVAPIGNIEPSSLEVLFDPVHLIRLTRDYVVHEQEVLLHHAPLGPFITGLMTVHYSHYGSGNCAS
jgi:hypothetical protein